MDESVTLESLGPRKTRFGGQWWDEHTCAEVDFTQMQYVIRLQGAYEPVDEWRTLSWNLRRSGTTWEVFRTQEEWSEAIADLRGRRIPLTRALVDNGTRGAPPDVVEMFKVELQDLENELLALENKGPGWDPLDADEQSVLEELYQHDLVAQQGKNNA